ncbi:MAG: hypothetical protein AAF192_01180 [Pseudomonadota bacterium]
MTDRPAVLAAIRARLSVVWPTATDVTEEPHGVAPQRLPAFAIAAEQVEIEPRACGRPGAYLATDAVTVSAWLEGRDLEARLRAAAKVLTDALARPGPALAGRVWDAVPDGADFEVDSGAKRVGRLDVRLLVSFEITPPATPADVDPFGDGFASDAFE